MGRLFPFSLDSTNRNSSSFSTWEYLSACRLVWGTIDSWGSVGVGSVRVLISSLRFVILSPKPILYVPFRVSPALDSGYRS